MAKKRKAGRPRGAKTKKAESVDTITSTCPKCGSSKRSKYTQHRRLDSSGRLPSGLVFCAVIWRRTKCLNCGQWRDDREFVPEVDG